MATIHFDGERVLAALRRLEKACADQSPALLEIGEYLVESTKQRFVSGIGPDGTPWPENSPVTIERKGRNQPLVGGGTLNQQIEKELVGSNILEIGSSMQYAAMQHFGGTKDEFPWLWGNIPERPFLGISEDDEAEILATIEDQLLSVL